MAERSTAEAQLLRVLHALPRANREGGAALDDLARELGVDRQRVHADLYEVMTRAYYHPAGTGEDLEVFLYPDRVEVRTKHERLFRRPVRLLPREVLALHLGLRAAAALGPPERRAVLADLAERLGRDLAARPEDGFGLPEGGERGVATQPELPDPERLRDVLFAAARDRVPCRVRYVKAHAADPEDRTIEPYAAVYAEGSWYVLGWCRESEGVRAFRMDRILEAHPAEGTFEVPVAFRPEDFLRDGRVYRADDEIDVVVRYSPAVARWILEREPGARPGPDGGVTLRHRVADPHWVVRHVLGYGPDARVVEPEGVRRMVAEAARRAAG